MYQQYEAWQYGNCPEWLQLGVVPITAGALLAESNYEVRPRLLKEYYLVWLRGGSGSMQSKGHQFHLKKWDLFLLFPGVVHAYQTDPQDLFDMFWIGFQGVSAKSLVEAAGFSPEAPVFSCAGHPQLLQSLENLSQISAQGNLSNCLAAGGSLLQVFGALLAARMVYTAPVMQRQSLSSLVTIAHNYINVHYPEPITIAEISSYVGVSRATLAALFRTEMGQTPSQYLCYVRIKHAAALLCQTSLPIHKVAHRVGYNDALYFSKVFSTQYGIAPSRFRILAQNTDDAPF